MSWRLSWLPLRGRDETVETFRNKENAIAHAEELAGRSLSWANTFWIDRDDDEDVVISAKAKRDPEGCSARGEYVIERVAARVTSRTSYFARVEIDDRDSPLIPTIEAAIRGGGCLAYASGASDRSCRLNSSSTRRSAMRRIA